MTDIFVLISTFGQGISRVGHMLLPCEDGVHYVVVWQTDGIETCLEWMRREDVTIVRQSGRGLSRSRNAALETAVSLLPQPLAEAIAIIADDDERIEPDAFARVRQAFASRPRLDIALMRVRSTTDGLYLKSYPPTIISYSKRPRSYYPCSLEMTMRLRVWHAGLRFDERFGLGSPRLCAGEEDVFLHDALTKGLQVLILPIDLAATYPVTTGSHVLNVKVLRSKGAVYGYERSLPGAILRSLREAVALGWRQRRSPWHIFRNIFYGVSYIRHSREQRSATINSERVPTRNLPPQMPRPEVM